MHRQINRGAEAYTPAPRVRLPRSSNRLRPSPRANHCQGRRLAGLRAACLLQALTSSRHSDRPLAMSARARREALRHISLCPRVLTEDAPWDEERLRDELRGALQEAGAKPTDLLDAWDINKDGTIRKREWLQNWKKLVGTSNELWYDKVRGAVEEAFDLINFEGDGFSKDTTLSINEIDRWLNPRRKCASPGRNSRGDASPDPRWPGSSRSPDGHCSRPASARTQLLWRPCGHRPAWPLEYGLQRDRQRLAAQKPTPIPRLSAPAYRPSPRRAADEGSDSPRKAFSCDLQEVPRLAVEAAHSPKPRPPPDVVYISRKLNWPPRGIRVLQPGSPAAGRPNVPVLAW